MHLGGIFLCWGSISEEGCDLSAGVDGVSDSDWEEGVWSDAHMLVMAAEQGEWSGDPELVFDPYTKYVSSVLG